MLITGSVDATVKVWKKAADESGFNEQKQFTGHRLGVLSVAVDQAGKCNNIPQRCFLIFFFKVCVSSSMDSMIRVWDLEKGITKTVIEAPPIEAWKVALSPDGKSIATGSQSGNVNIFNLDSGQKEKTLDTLKKSFTIAIAYVRIHHHHYHLTNFFCRRVQKVDF